MTEWLVMPGWIDVVDIAVVAIFGWLAIGYVRRTRARAALVGLAFLGVVYFLARSLELRLSASIFQTFFAALVLLLVVVFQEDLRRVFEELGTWWRGRTRVPEESETLDMVVRTLVRLASNRVGALVVLPGADALDRHVEGGVLLGGRVSEPLLLSIFDSSSPGHDGAVLLRGSVIERFALHLPLSANMAAVGPGGTRHAAALGLSERCDAICLVVSEERGTISIARDGEIRALARPEDLASELRAVYQDEAVGQVWWKGRFGLDAVLAFAGALILWTVFIPGSDMSETTITTSIEVLNLPKDLQLESIEPPSVEVTLRGLRRDLMLVERDGISVELDAYLARLGRRTFSVSAAEVKKPDTLSVVAVAPERVRISLEAVATPEGSSP